MQIQSVRGLNLYKFGQYALAKRARRGLFLPEKMQAPGRLQRERKAADGDVELFFDFGFVGGVFIPVGEGEAAVDFSVFGGEEGVKVFEVIDGDGVLVAKGGCLGEEIRLDVVQDGADLHFELLAREGGGVAVGFVAAGEAEGGGVDFTRADFEAKGNPFLDPAPRLFPAAQVARVDDDFEGLAIVILGAEGGGEFFAITDDFGARFFIVDDGDDDDMGGGDAGRENEAVVVAMGHDEGADEAGGRSPRSGPSIFLIAFDVAELDAARFGEILPEKVGGSRLERFSVLHHRFDGIGVDGAGESL